MTTIDLSLHTDAHGSIECGNCTGNCTTIQTYIQRRRSLTTGKPNKWSSNVDRQDRQKVESKKKARVKPRNPKQHSVYCPPSFTSSIPRPNWSLLYGGNGCCQERLKKRLNKTGCSITSPMHYAIPHFFFNFADLFLPWISNIYLSPVSARAFLIEFFFLFCAPG